MTEPRRRQRPVPVRHALAATAYSLWFRLRAQPEAGLRVLCPSVVHNPFPVHAQPTARLCPIRESSRICGLRASGLDVHCRTNGHAPLFIAKPVRNWQLRRPQRARCSVNTSAAVTARCSVTRCSPTVSLSGASFQSLSVQGPRPRKSSFTGISRAFRSVSAPRNHRPPLRRTMTRCSPTAPSRTRVSSQTVGTIFRKSRPG